MFSRLEQEALRQMIAERDDLGARVVALEGAFTAIKLKLEEMQQQKRPTLTVAMEPKSARR